MKDVIRDQLIKLYGDARGRSAYKNLCEILNKYSAENKVANGKSRGKLS